MTLVDVQSSWFLHNKQSTSSWLLFLPGQYHIPPSHMWNTCCENSTELSSCSMLDSHLPMADVVVCKVIWSNYSISERSSDDIRKLIINIPNGEGSDWPILILGLVQDIFRCGFCSLRLVLHGVLTTWVNLTTYESRNQVDLPKLQVKANFSNPLGCILDGFRISMSQIGDVDYCRKFWRPQKV